MKFRDPARARIVFDFENGKAVSEIDKLPAQRKKPDRKSHASAVAAVVKLLRLSGCYARAVHSQSRLLPDGTYLPGLNKGLLDIYAIVPVDAFVPSEPNGPMRRVKIGRSLWIDWKIGRDKMKPAQADFAAAVRSWGGVAGVARSIEDVQQLLDEARQ